MMLTEQEASTKRCQEGYAASPGASKNPQTDYMQQSFMVPSMSSLSLGSAAVATTAAAVTAPIFCLGSACMAWRWYDDVDYEDGEPLPFGATPADPGWEKDGEVWVAGAGILKGGEMRQRWRRPLARKGYCGKAGAP